MLLLLVLLPLVPPPSLHPQVGMQNSTLGAVLAALHFSDPLTAAPCAVSACTHSVMGSLLAAVWRRTSSAET